MNTVAEPNQVMMPEIATPSASSSDKLLGRIATLLLILVAGLLTVFGYYASSICITVVLAGSLAILFDPLVVKLERLHGADAASNSTLGALRRSGFGTGNSLLAPSFGKNARGR